MKWARGPHVGQPWSRASTQTAITDKTVVCLSWDRFVRSLVSGYQYPEHCFGCEGTIPESYYKKKSSEVATTPISF